MSSSAKNSSTKDEEAENIGTDTSGEGRHMTRVLKEIYHPLADGEEEEEEEWLPFHPSADVAKVTAREENELFSNPSHLDLDSIRNFLAIVKNE